MIRRFQTTMSTLADITISVSLVVALMSYFSQIEQSRKDASFEILSRINAGELLSAQRHISAEILRSDIRQFAGIEVPRSTMAAFIDELAQTSEDQNLFDQDVFALVSHFDDTQTCIETGTCDPEIIQAHMGETVERYACLLLPYVFERRKDYLLDGLGEKMAQLAGYEARC